MSALRQLSHPNMFSWLNFLRLKILALDILEDGSQVKNVQAKNLNKCGKKDISTSICYEDFNKPEIRCVPF